MLGNPSQRVGVFVDVQNLYYSARAMHDSNVNFGKLLQTAVGDRQLIRAIAYVIKSEAPKEQGFFDALAKAGLEVKSKDIQIFGDGQKKGDWDVGIAVDAIKIADRLDVVVLATGDGDFVPLVTYLRENRGCLVEGISFERSTSAKLIEVLDNFTDIAANPKQYLFRSR
ncbi:MAG: NYN domain-containing protein [Patescibacteria group bacterium]